MFGYRVPMASINLTTDRLIVRTAQYQDAHRLSLYYDDNKAHLKPWEPRFDDSQYSLSGCQIRLKMIEELQQVGSSRYFFMLDKEGDHIVGIINFSQIIKGHFHACYLGYSIAERYQGQGLMHEALTCTIRYMFRKEQIHRIMAGYMPHNHRSGKLLARLGFEKEGYAKDYLFINGQWQDHILMALINPDWQAVK